MNNKTVMLFDDDAQILDVCTMVLEFSGYDVITSATVENIVEQVMVVRPDVILMDNWIPDIGGVRATQLIKQDENIRHIPVIYISANSDIEDLAREAGADLYLAKPFDLEQLERAVQDSIG